MGAERNAMWTEEKAKEYRKEHYLRNKDKYKKAAAESKKRIRSEIRRIICCAKSVPCADCGNTYPTYVMQFDHIGKKNFNIADSLRGMSAKKVVEEISVCEVVCANCHAERTHRRRVGLPTR